MNVVLPDQKLQYGTAIRSGLKPVPKHVLLTSLSISSTLKETKGKNASNENNINSEENSDNNIDDNREIEIEVNDINNNDIDNTGNIDMQSTRRAKRYRTGREMQVFTSSQNMKSSENHNEN